jgi:hypothetical protein
MAYEKTFQRGKLVSFRVDASLAQALADVAKRELLTGSGIARRALVDDMRRRGALAE